MFDNKRYLTRGVDERIPLLVQLTLWELVEEIPNKKKRLPTSVRADVAQRNAHRQTLSGSPTLLKNSHIHLRNN